VPFVSLAVALGVAATCQASDEDFFYWSKATFLISVAEDWQFAFEHKLGFDEEARRLDHHQQDYGFVYGGVGDWLKLFAAVKVVHARSDDRDEWLQEIRPHANAAVFSTLFDLDMVNRSRIEYRDTEDEGTFWRFRHRLAFVLPQELTPLRIKPYVSEEVFYSFNADRFHGNRVQAGLFIPLHEGVRLELFYFWHLDKEAPDDWCDANVVGSYVRFTF
jgi:hypothetical protein